ncbi:MAG: hypothetical protein HY738_06655 [Bacteroidia bacterium]|nr:hypothetical protein [Bacteroidia bacterium]
MAKYFKYFGIVIIILSVCRKEPIMITYNIVEINNNFIGTWGTEGCCRQKIIIDSTGNGQFYEVECSMECKASESCTTEFRTDGKYLLIDCYKWLIKEMPTIIDTQVVLMGGRYKTAWRMILTKPKSSIFENDIDKTFYKI